jgi:hypothetical protein
MKNTMKNLALDYLRILVAMITISWMMFFLIGVVALIIFLLVEEYISMRAAIILHICWLLHLPLGVMYTGKIMDGKFVSNI